MNLFQVNNPIRVADRGGDKYYLAVPREQIKILINKEVKDFIDFLNARKNFDGEAIQIYLDENNITNKKDYETLFHAFIEEKIIVPVGN